MRHRCPVCRKVIEPALREQSQREKFYPFCSQRCKLIDLGKWLDGNYRIIAELKSEELEEVDEVSANRTQGQPDSSN